MGPLGSLVDSHAKMERATFEEPNARSRICLDFSLLSAKRAKALEALQWAKDGGHPCFFDSSRGIMDENALFSSVCSAALTTNQPREQSGGGQLGG